MKYSHCQGKSGAWIEPYYCDNYFCEPDCECGITFAEAKEDVISYYENQLSKARELSEDDY